MSNRVLPSWIPLADSAPAHATIFLIIVFLAACTGSSPVLPAGPPAQALWTHPFPSGTLAALVVEHGRAYLLHKLPFEPDAAPKHLFAVDTSSGKELWRCDAPMVTRFADRRSFANTLDVLASGGNVYYLGTDEKVHAVDGSSGRQIWEWGPVSSLLSASHGSVYIFTKDFWATALNGVGGSVRWKMIPCEKESRVQVAGGRIFISGKALRVFDEKTGKQLWSFPGNNSNAEPLLLAALTAELVCVYNGGANYGLDARSGKTIWKIPSHREILAIDGQLAYYPEYPNGRTNNLHVVDSQRGTERSVIEGYQWQTIGTLAADAGLVYAPMWHARSGLSALDSAADTCICAVDALSHQRIWCSPWRYEFISTPVLAEGKMFLAATGARDGPSTLYAFRAGRFPANSLSHNR